MCGRSKSSSNSRNNVTTTTGRQVKSFSQRLHQQLLVARGHIVEVCSWKQTAAAAAAFYSLLTH
jgi:hypothetical protein